MAAIGVLGHSRFVMGCIRPVQMSSAVVLPSARSVLPSARSAGVRLNPQQQPSKYISTEATYTKHHTLGHTALPPGIPGIHHLHQRSFADCKTESELVGSLDTPDYLVASDPETGSVIASDFLVIKDFISEAEEESLFNEVEPYLKRLRYEQDHWDDAIHKYRETERKKWNSSNQKILGRVQDVAFTPDTPKLAYIHVLDITKTGYIKPHIDSVRFCGSTIAGLSLMSSSVMRLAHEKSPESVADVLLRQRSLYIMKGAARFEYTHEILKDDVSIFKGEHIPRERRISIILRNEASATDQP